MLLKTKDIFTLGTIIAGFLVLPLAAQGMLYYASLLMLLGFFLDGLDGWYARLTKTGNKFGAEFDCIADLIIYCMAPSILLYFVYAPYHIILASVVGVFPLLFGCIRLARFNVKRIEYPGYWMGFPRPGSMLVIVGLVNSYLFQTYDLLVVGAILVFLLGLMNITVIPYMGHHNRKFSTTHKVLLGSMFVFLIASIFLGFVWDVVLVYGVAYLVSPLFIPKASKKKIKKFIADWKKDE